MNRGIKLSFAMSLGFCALSGASLVALSSPRLSATEITATATANATVSVAEACTMQSGSSTDTPHTATIPAGTNKSDIGQTTFKVICNDTAGFSVYAVGFANYEVGNTKLLATVGGTLNPTYDIETGLNMTNTTSSWAMKLTPVSGAYAPTITTGYTDYHVVPSTNTKVATYAGVTDGGTNANGSAFTATYRANISGTQPAGNYNGKVKYTMVHPASEAPTVPVTTPSGYISYNPNATGVVDRMGDQYISNGAIRTDLWTSNFQRSGYGFAGWSETHDYSDSTKFHGPNETIKFTANQYSGSNPGLSLYAIWIKSAGAMQNWGGCSNLNIGDVTALTDQRDSQTYAVAKLADGKCWMIENLRLNNQYSTGGTNIALSQGYGSNFVGLANSESANFSNSTIANTLYRVDTDTSSTATNVIDSASHTYNSTNYSGYYFPRYNNSNTAFPSTNMTANSQVAYSGGNYYTWTAAVADTSLNNTNNQSLSTSICPRGWRLPAGGQITVNTTGDFYILVKTLMDGTEPNQNTSNGYGYYGDSGSTIGTTASNSLRAYPNNFILSGYYTNSSATGRGSNGRYWLSTATDGSGTAYSSILNASTVYPGSDNTSIKYSGYSIRCIANN